MSAPQPAAVDARWHVHLGDCVAWLLSLPEASVDAIVCDPPYGLSPDGRARTWDDVADGRARGGFMGRAWDAACPGRTWAEACLRALKPGGHLVAFGATRTIHRLVCAVEDAGFGVREMIGWTYFSGFPKSIDVQYPIMVQAGVCLSNEPAPHVVPISRFLRVESDAVKGPIAVALARIPREAAPGLLIRIGGADATPVAMAMSSSTWAGPTSSSTGTSWRSTWAAFSDLTRTSITATEIAEIIGSRIWNSAVARITSGTITHRKETRPNGCKCPASAVVRSWSDSLASFESIPTCFVAVNATWPTADTGLLVNPDALGNVAPCDPEIRRRVVSATGLGSALKPAYEPAILARKPLVGTVAQNVLRYGTGALDIDATRFAHGDPAWVGPQDEVKAYPEGPGGCTFTVGGAPDGTRSEAWIPPVGGRWPANLYHCPKASRSERERGCDDLPIRTGAEAVDREEGSAGTRSPRAGAGRTAGAIRNHHIAVKPVQLMRWLCRLVTPPGGLVVDPFTGSGSTGVAALLEGFRFAGAEMEPDYHAIATARIAHAALHPEEWGGKRKAKKRPKPPAEAPSSQVLLFGGAK